MLFKCVISNHRKYLLVSFICNDLIKLDKRYRMKLSDHELIKYWDFSKNTFHSPSRYLITSRYQFYWLCPKQHSFEASICQMVKSFKCPICSSLGSLHPTLSIEWHPTLNKPFTPFDFLSGSGKKVWWICSAGHSFKTEVWQRTHGSSCPYCSGYKVCRDTSLGIINPKLSAEWDTNKNGKLTPYDVTPNSSKEVQWKCKAEHEWSARISARNLGNACPYCSGKQTTEKKNLLVCFPDIAAEWDYDKNGNHTPEETTIGSDYNAHWICRKPNHTWQARVHKRTSNNQGCPYCSNRRVCSDNNLAVINPELALDWHPLKNDTLGPSQVLPVAKRTVWWQCQEKKHEWQAPIYSRAAGRGCPKCYCRLSKLQILIYAELSHYFKSIKLEHTLHGVSVDVYLPKSKLAIEVDGSWWHKDKLVFDTKKGNILNSKGVTLIRLRAIPLKKINDVDFVYSEKDKHTEVFHHFLKHLITYHPFSKTFIDKIKARLQTPSILEAKLYSQIFNSRFSPPKHKSVLAIAPQLAKEWDYEKNNGLLPESFYAYSDEKVFWKCSRGHSTKAVIKNRVRGAKCNLCKYIRE